MCRLQYGPKNHSSLSKDLNSTAVRYCTWYVVSGRVFERCSMAADDVFFGVVVLKFSRNNEPSGFTISTVES